MNSHVPNNIKISPKEMVIFSMLGTILFCSKIIMEVLPNIHLLGTLTMIYTVVYRKKALIPIYIYILLNGIYAGFATWWIPYTYIWAVLWLFTMLIPKNLPDKALKIIYPCVCAFHGLIFGILYAPAQALIFSLSFKQMLAWIGAGFVWDIVHCVGNFATGFLIFPLSSLIKKYMSKSAKT